MSTSVLKALPGKFDIKRHSPIVFSIYCSQVPSLNAAAKVSSQALDIKFGLSLHLHPFFVYVSSEGSGESAHLRRLARAFASRNCNKYKKKSYLRAQMSYFGPQVSFVVL